MSGRQGVDVELGTSMPLDPRARRLLDMLALGAGKPGGPMSATQRRASFRALMAMSRVAVPLVAVDDRSIEGPGGPLAVRLYTPPEAGDGPRPGLVFFHGGGLVAGDLDTHDGLCRRLAAESRACIVAVDYRLAPEHPFPAAVDDAVAATRTVLDGAAAFHLDPTRIAVGGDSAGGTLATLAASALAGRLAFQLLLCPVLDLAERRPSRLAYGEGYMLDQAIMDRDLSDYLPAGQDPADARISPLRARDLSCMPRTLLHTAEFDPLRDEGAAYAAALRQAGVPVQMTCHAGMIHHFLGLEGVLPAARAALPAIGAEMAAAFV